MERKIQRKKETLITRFENFICSSKKGFFIGYTALFALMCIIIFSTFAVNGKGFVWDLDGYTQHYKAFMYLGQWGREILRTLLSEHRLEVPMWDFSIGYGSDIITSMHYYAFGDLLDLVSIAVPTKFSEIAYELLIVLRMYLAGGAFSLFCFKMNKKKTATLAGSIAYVFCGYALYAGLRHPFFLNPMIYLPLVLLGAEKILRKEKPWLFIVMIFVTTLSNFYFLYMIAFAVVLYVVIRYFTMEREKSFKDFAVNVGKFVLSAILGIAMSAVIFLPVINVFLTSNRLNQTSQPVSLFYEITYYLKLMTGMFSSTTAGKWTCIGFAVPVFAAIVVMFLHRKKYTGLKIGLVILILMICFPVAGKIMNGFAYVNNRWTFILAGLMAYILVSVWDDLLNLSQKRIVALFICSAVYFLLILISPRDVNVSSYITIIILFAVVILLLLSCNSSLSALSKKTASVCLVLIVALSCCITGHYEYSPSYGDYVSDFKKFNTCLSDTEDSTDKVFAKLTEKEDTFVRSDQYDCSDDNAAVITGNYGTQFFWSLENGNISNFMTENSLCNNLSQKYDGLNTRTHLQALASVKYYAQKSDSTVPYGYEKLKKVRIDDEKYTVYENTNPLPLGYTYSSYISKKDYLNMTAEEKQQAMLQGVVLDDSENIDLSVYEKSQPEYINRVVDSKIELGKKIALQKDGSFVVNKKKAKITITFDGLENSETYLRLSGIKVEKKTTYQLYTDDCQEYFSTAEFEEKSKQERNKIKKADFFDSESEEDKKIKFTAKSDGVKQWFKYYAEDHKYYSGQSDYLMNLGYSEEGKTEITLAFPEKGVYSFDAIEVICQPMDNFNSQVNALKEDILENEAITTNSVSGDITLDEDKILCLSIPYSTGWTATVDGEEVELLNANTMYMAIPLKAGTHKIKLNYTTPALKAGATITVVSSAILVAAVIITACVGRRKKKKSAVSK